MFFFVFKLCKIKTVQDGVTENIGNFSSVLYLKLQAYIRAASLAFFIPPQLFHPLIRTLVCLDCYFKNGCSGVFLYLSIIISEWLLPILV